MVLGSSETFLSISCWIPLCFADVNVAFQRAAHKVLLDDDNLLPLLHLTVDYQGKDKGEVAVAAPGSLVLLLPSSGLFYTNGNKTSANSHLDTGTTLPPAVCLQS